MTDTVQLSGTQFWDHFDPVGRPRTFATPAELWEACKRYFRFVIENPMQDEKIFCSQGEVTRAPVYKPRTMTRRSMLVFINVAPNTWGGWRGSGPNSRPDLHEVIRAVENAIEEWVLSHASAGMMDPTIASRLLGLAERQIQTIDAVVYEDRTELTLEEMREEMERRGLPPFLLMDEEDV